MKVLRFDNLYIVYTEKIDGNQRVEENRKKVLQNFSFEKVFLPIQKHTNKVVKHSSLPQEADGVFADRKCLPIGVLTADCMPIVLFDNERLSVLHAGWRGLFSGIIQNGLKNHAAQNTKAFILPSIRKCCYQVDKSFISNLNISDRFFEKRKDGIYLSLQKVAKNILMENGIDKIYEVPICTGCCDNLYSYRKGDFEERIMTFAWFE